MPSTLSTGIGQSGVLARSNDNYLDQGGGQYLQQNVVLTPNSPVFDINTIYHLSNGPGTPDISVKFKELIKLPSGINIRTYAI